MVSFKESLETDLDTFFNENEFADIHDIDGQQVDCIIDNDTIKSSEKSDDGVYVSTTKIFVKARDLLGHPVEGQHIKVDSEIYIVADCTENNGLLEITLEANMS